MLLCAVELLDGCCWAFFGAINEDPTGLTACRFPVNLRQSAVCTVPGEVLDTPSSVVPDNPLNAGCCRLVADAWGSLESYVVATDSYSTVWDQTLHYCMEACCLWIDPSSASAHILVGLVPPSRVADSTCRLSLAVPAHFPPYKWMLYV
ncbi:uncharacterized protein LOC127862627 [Dreissena polymorpha]|uniref:uncharacterized protein LOC127862627 n=1 Tax=Dreissena polymorpha TaxID=45954 RepID=UPI00226500A4|nr:uncharacterized protein LOC127862627 [Dreissena polymorpha]